MSVASSYRATIQKTVTLEGFNWTIRKVPPTVLGRVMEITQLKAGSTQAEAEEAVRSKIFDIAKIILPACMVSPKVTLSGVGDDNTLTFDELSVNVMNGLLDEIYDFSGLGPEAQAERQAFRPDTTSPDSNATVKAPDAPQ